MHGADAGHGVGQVCDLRRRQRERHRRHPVAQRHPRAAANPRGEEHRRQVEHHLPAGKSLGAFGDQAEGLVGLQVHQQALGGDEHPVRRVHPVHPAVVQRRLRAHRDPIRVRQQPVAQLDDRRQIDSEPTELVADTRRVQPVEAGLQALGERHDGGRRMVDEVAPGVLVEGQRPQRHVLAAGEAELGEVEVDRVDQLDRHRVIDDGVRPARLGGPHQQRQQRRLGDPGQGGAVCLAHRSTLSSVRRLRVVVDDL